VERQRVVSVERARSGYEIKQAHTRRSSVTRIFNSRTLRPLAPAPLTCLKRSRSPGIRTIDFAPNVFAQTMPISLPISVVLGLEGRESVICVGFDYVILDTATLRSSLWLWLNEYVPHCPDPSGLVMVNRDFPVGVPATGDVRRNAPGFVARMSVSPR
jgi:hypothetical protein